MEYIFQILYLVDFRLMLFCVSTKTAALSFLFSGDLDKYLPDNLFKSNLKEHRPKL